MAQNKSNALQQVNVDIITETSSKNDKNITFVKRNETRLRIDATQNIVFRRDFIMIEKFRFDKDGNVVGTEMKKVGRALEFVKLYKAVEDGQELVELKEASAVVVNPMHFVVPVTALIEPARYKAELNDLYINGYTVGTKAPQSSYTVGWCIYEYIVAGLADGTITHELFAKTAGWHFPDGEKIAMPMHILSGYDSRFASSQVKIFDRKGDKETYKEYTRKLIAENPNLAIWMGAAVAGFLRGFIDPDNAYIYHLYDNEKTSTGKTMVLEVCASMISKTKHSNVLKQWNITATGMENILKACNHAFICLDEFHSLRMDDNSKTLLLMQIANQESKTAGTHAGGLREQKSWSLNIISTGNVSMSACTIGHQQENAVNTRFWEVDIEKMPVWTFDDSIKADEIKAFYNANHGHLYEDIIATISENAQKYINIYELMNKANQDQAIQAKVDSEARKGLVRKLKVVSLMIAGIAVLQDLLDIDCSEAINNALNGMINKQIEKTKEVVTDKFDDVFTEVESFVTTHQKHFIIDGAMNREHNERAIQNKLAGKVKFDADGRVTWIAIKNDAKDTTRFSEQIIKQWVQFAENNGILEMQGGKVTKVVRDLGRCYVINFAAYQKPDQTEKPIPF